MRTILGSDQSLLDDPASGSRVERVGTGDGAAVAVETTVSTEQTELLLTKSRRTSGLRRQLVLMRWPWLYFPGTWISRFNRCCVTDQPLD